MANDNPQPGNRFTGTMPNTPPNTSSPDKVFGGSMPTGQMQPETNTVASQQIYGNQNFYSQNLQGHQTTTTYPAQSSMQPGQTTPQPTNYLYTQQMANSQAMYGQNYNQSMPPTGYPQPNQNYTTPPTPPAPQPRRPQNTLFGMQAASNYEPLQLETTDSKIDYLNSIAPNDSSTTSHGSLLSDKKMLFVFGAGIFAVILLIVILVVGSKKAPTVSVGSIVDPAYDLQQIAITGQAAPQLDTETRMIANQVALILQSKTRSLVGQADAIKPETGLIEKDEDAKKAIDSDFEKIKSSGNANIAFLKYTNNLIDKTTDQIYEIASSHSNDSELMDTLDSTYKDLLTMRNRIDGVITRKTQAE